MALKVAPFTHPDNKNVQLGVLVKTIGLVGGLVDTSVVQRFRDVTLNGGLNHRMPLLVGGSIKNIVTAMMPVTGDTNSFNKIEIVNREKRGEATTLYVYLQEYKVNQNPLSQLFQKRVIQLVSGGLPIPARDIQALADSQDLMQALKDGLDLAQAEAISAAQDEAIEKVLTYCLTSAKRNTPLVITVDCNPPAEKDGKRPVYIKHTAETVPLCVISLMALTCYLCNKQKLPGGDLVETLREGCIYKKKPLMLLEHAKNKLTEWKLKDYPEIVQQIYDSVKPQA